MTKRHIILADTEIDEIEEAIGVAISLAYNLHEELDMKVFRRTWAIRWQNSSTFVQNKSTFENGMDESSDIRKFVVQ